MGGIQGQFEQQTGIVLGGRQGFKVVFEADRVSGAVLVADKVLGTVLEGRPGFRGSCGSR